ncbi:MAG: dephospho-CoA kinase [Acidobacteriota bacterium]
MRKILRVSLTGGIATGKSIISDVLKEKGCFISKSDLIAHKLMMPGEVIWEQIVFHFGDRILNPNKTINRKTLGAIVFSNEKERDYLNNLIHPKVLEEKKKIIEKLERDRKYKIFVSEAALTIEAGFEKYFHKIIVAHCPDNIRVKRLMERDKISENEALKKIRSQMDNEEKIKKADYVIDTSGTIEETRKRTLEIYESLLIDWKILNSLEKERKNDKKSIDKCLG